MSLLSRFSKLFRPHALDSDLDEEIRSHLQMSAEMNQDAGMSPADARRRALQHFGNTAYTKEDMRSASVLRWLETTLQDIRYAVRVLFKSRGFAIAAALTLAIGIGAATVIFGVLDAVLLRPLPYPNADRVLWITEAPNHHGGMSVAMPNYFDWHDQNHSFSAMAARRGNQFSLTGTGLPISVQGILATHEYFRVLGVRPVLGRDFTADDDHAGATRTVIISNGFWHRQFASDPNIIGRVVDLDQRPHVIIGVLPPLFNNVEQVTAVYVPFGLYGNEPWWTERGGHHGPNVVGLLKPDVSRTQAQTDLDSIAERLQRQYPDTNRDKWVGLLPLRDRLIVGSSRPILLLLMSAVACLLLIGCGNVANLLLARAAARSKEIAIRVALGASRMRLLRQLLTESLLLALIGGCAGVLLAWWGNHLVSRGVADAVSPLAQVALDLRVLLFAFAISVLTGIVFGLAPSLHTSSYAFAEHLKQSGRGSHASGTQRLRDSLVIAELAVSLALLAGAGLLTRSFIRVLQVNPGFEPHNLSAAIINIPATRYGDLQKGEAFFDEVLRQIRSVPGVTSASEVVPLPLSFEEWDTDYQLEGDAPTVHRNTEYSYVGAGYAKTMQIPVLKGREFNEGDTQSSLPVAMVNERFADKFWPGENPIGKRIRLDLPHGSDARELARAPWRTVVGVLGNVQQYGQDARPDPFLYEPFTQSTASTPATYRELVVRSAVGLASVADDLRKAVARVDPDQALSSMQTMDKYLADSLAARRLTMALLGTFAVLATLLAGIGIYGVLSYWVEQRTREIGIRVALGARRGQVIALILRHAGFLVIISLVLGVAASLAVGRWLRSMLFGVSSVDVLVFAAVTLAIAALALLASYVPALRATRVDPMIALRAE
jgi:predicted permease